MSRNEEINVIDEKKQPEVTEIVASSIRSGLAKLEMQTSKALRGLEYVRSTETEEKPTSQELREDKKPTGEILESIERLISYPNSYDDPEFPLPALDDISYLALMSHSIVAYLSHLDRKHVLRVTSHIVNDTSRWLGNLFRFLDPAASYHTDCADAVLQAVRLAIVSRCPGYLEGGVPALANPCFYITENTTPVLLQYACRQLGIPLEAIRLIPTDSIFGTMDLSLLQKQIQFDINANRTPLLVIADVGGSKCGTVDNLFRMRDICNSNKMWLHATGHCLASLVCAQGPGLINGIVDSIIISLSAWLAVASLPIVLLHRQISNAALTAFESDPLISRRLNSLLLWTTLQALGKEQICTRIKMAFKACSSIYKIASKCEGVRVVTREPRLFANSSSPELTNQPTDFNLLFDKAVPSVVFFFDGIVNVTPEEEAKPASTTGDENQDLTQVIINKSIEKIANASYFDHLNSWLGQNIQRDCPNIDFEIFEHRTNGTCIRFCPLELGVWEIQPQDEQLENFEQSLEKNVDILLATIKHKATFTKLVEKSDVLRLVHLPDWAGMGGVRFVPEGWEAMLTDQAKTELNRLNVDLVEALKSTDNAFSLDESPDNFVCVRFGMVTHETDVEELLDLVISVGKSLQENSRVLDTMSEIVKKGIEAATADLQRETEEKIWQDGILRNVPVFGRVFNWWSPPVKEGGIKGRSLNLTQGVVESTENIYKYHMQMTGAPNQLPANKSPPTPMVQTPVGTTASAGHSRTVSQSSGTSAHEIAVPNPSNGKIINPNVNVVTAASTIPTTSTN